MNKERFNKNKRTLYKNVFLVLLERCYETFLEKPKNVSTAYRKPYKGGFGRGGLCWYPPEKKRLFLGCFWPKEDEDER